MAPGANGIVLEARDLRKAFGGVHAVDGCSFAIPRGKICGLIGPNGSGKTTTFNLLTGLAQPDGGQVLHDGVDLVGVKRTRRHGACSCAIGPHGQPTFRHKTEKRHDWRIMFA
jgi:ABC-type branched-subunit amino acid transport system ATPase component